MFRDVIILLLLLVLAGPASAVDTLQVTTPDPILEDWRWTTFDQTSGLAGPIRDIIEDQEGNIWFAADNGAQRYDGYRWTTYTTDDGLAHDRVADLLQAQDGSMWFGTRSASVISAKHRMAPSGSAATEAHWSDILQIEMLPRGR